VERTIAARPRGAVWNVATIVVLGPVLLLAWNVASDFGTSWDHSHQWSFGRASLQLAEGALAGDDTAILEALPARMRGHIESHGPWPDLGYVWLAQRVGVDSERDEILWRYRLNFSLFWVGLLIAYALYQREFRDRFRALVGVGCLVVMPRVFSHAFYNTVDIPFLVFFTAATYTHVRVLERTSVARIVTHALVCGLLVSTRAGGLLLPALTGALLTARLISDPRPLRPRLGALCLFTLATLASVFVLWPYLWTNPIERVRGVLSAALHISWDLQVLYFGELTAMQDLPWHYTPVWIALTTPPIYLLLAALGAGKTVARLADSGVSRVERECNLSFLFLLLVPIALPILLQSPQYDGWRHHFFLYPLIVLMLLRGTTSFRRGVSRSRVSTLLGGALAVQIVVTTVDMARLHPQQGVYFNVLAGSRDTMRHRFELDYWGLAYREGLERVLARKPASAELRVQVATPPGLSSVSLLKPHEQARLVVTVSQHRDAYDFSSPTDYFLTTYRWHPGDYPLTKLDSVVVDGMEILGIYRGADARGSADIRDRE